VEVSQFSHCCGQIPSYFIKQALCSAHFCQLPNLLQGARSCKVNRRDLPSTNTSPGVGSVH